MATATTSSTAAITISNTFLSIVLAEVIMVILYNLQQETKMLVSFRSNNARTSHRPTLSVIGSVLPLLLSITVLCCSSPITPTLALSAQPHAAAVVVPPKNNVIAITHAAGRMGKLLALQLREDAALRYNQGQTVNGVCGDDAINGDATDNTSDNTNDGIEAHLPKIRAIVRSEKEAYSVKCDLGGMTMAGGVARPIECDWLETIVIDSSTLTYPERAGVLRTAFEGCRAAILCDSAHNELVWTEECEVDETDDNCGFKIIVPASDSQDLSKRLLEEIDATQHSNTLEHVVLRSTMGLAVARAAEAHKLYLKQKPLVPFEGGVDWESLAGAMGGEAALAGPRNAETAFGRLAELRPDRKHTILRLGALTDDPGMVPLVFGSNDSILIKTADDGTKNNKPPLLSRSDAARLSTVLVRPANNDDSTTSTTSTSNNLLAVDCAWHPTYGRDSVGREETVSAAARQDLNIRAILEAIPEGQPQEEVFQ